MPLLDIQDLNVYYGGIRALSHLSIHVDAGEIISIIGANGAGKSTLMLTITGDKKPQSGTIRFEGNALPAESYKIVQRGISLVPEGRRIFPGLTVYENLMTGAYIRNDKAGIQKDMEEVFSLFPRLKERIKQHGGSLSGGEQQMLALGRALLARPKLLLLDEPSLGLAPIVIDELFDKLVEINKSRGLTMIMVEQNAYVALDIAHRSYVLSTGEIVMEGTGQELLEEEGLMESYLGTKEHDSED